VIELWLTEDFTKLLEINFIFFVHGPGEAFSLQCCIEFNNLLLWTFNFDGIEVQNIGEWDDCTGGSSLVHLDFFNLLYSCLVRE
jgi:hypothetical protein